MLGIVGKLKVDYRVENTQYEEIIDILTVKEFSLVGATNLIFSVDEIRYIEDTIYYILLSVCGLEQEDNEILVDGKDVKFDIPQFCISGNMSLIFLNQ